MTTSFYNPTELRNMGFSSIGENVCISRKASFYSPETINIGNNVRIDDFCILSGEIIIGNSVHIAAFSALYGKFGIELQDYSGISPRCTLLSGSDDFSGNMMIGPLLPEAFTNVTGGTITFEKYVQVGAHSVILPNIVLHEGAATGAMTLVNKYLDAWTVYVGIPARILCKREQLLLRLAANL